MPIVDLWLAIASQWRTIALANGRVYFECLDRAAVKVDLDLAALTVTPDQWGALRIMEAAARSALNGEA